MNRVVTRTLAGLLALILGALATSAQQEDHYYTVDYLTPPDGVRLEVGGMDFLSDGRLVVSTRRGQVWIIENPLAAEADDPRIRFELFAEGLDEGLGLHVRDEGGRDAIYVLQRGELSKLVDRDGDGRADIIATINNEWGLSGNYHEFAFGLPADDAGHFFLSLNVSFFSPKWWHGKSPAPWRGWVLRVDEAGELHPVAHGLRSPCGLGFNTVGDLFVTDNQGDWMPAGPVFHIREGRFYGHPASLDWTEDYARHGARASDTLPPDAKRAPAAVWLPYKWSRSAGNLVPDDTNGRFGPFGDQMFVGEVTNGMVLRTQLEKVRDDWDEYQGAVFLFRQDIGSVARVAFAPDGTLFCGMTNRGWGGLAPADGIARVRWTGEVPMEMGRVHLLQDGFEITFTKPVAPDVALGPEHVTLTQYDYDWWWEYGSPERHTAVIEVTDVSLSDDRTVARVRTAGLTPAMVARMVLSGVVADDGSPLLHDEFAYTINQLPEGPLTDEHVAKRVPPPPPRESQDEGWLRLSYGDALDAWDAEGWSLVNAELDHDNPTTFVAEPGNNALVNVGGDPPTDYVGRYELGDGLVHVEFMLPEGGRTTLWIQGRYGIALTDDAAARSGVPATGTLLGVDGGQDIHPTFDAYHGAGQWHSLDVRFEAPRFGEDGARLSPARLHSVMIDDVQLHDALDLAGPSAGALFADEAPVGPLIIDGTTGPVALRTLRFKPTTSGEAVADEGWVRIFNGETLDGWTLSPDAATFEHDEDDIEASTAVLGGWRVEDGVLIGQGDRSHLFSPRIDYTDLEFRARVRINEIGNSGMYFRVTRGPGWPAGYEAQVNSAYTDPQRTGSLYALAPVTVSLVAPGTWFTQHITCRDTDEGVHVTIRINDVVVTDYVDTERLHTIGHVALQQHHDGSVVEYADIEVRELR